MTAPVPVPDTASTALPAAGLRPTFGAVIIGDEILSGKRPDAHLSKLIELLGQRGCLLGWAQYLGDDPQRLTQTFAHALAGTDIVFSFGGIGSTPDDHTRQSAAAALGRALVLHPEARRLIDARMRKMADEAGQPFDTNSPQHRYRLAMGEFPEGSLILPNPYNGIPGFSCRGPQGGWLHCMPGFPVMAWPMAAWALDHHHGHLHQRGSMMERSIILIGAMESNLTSLMQHIEDAHPEVRVFSLPSVDHPEYGRHIELGVKGSPQAVDAAWQALREGLGQLPLMREGPQQQRLL